MLHQDRARTIVLRAESSKILLPRQFHPEAWDALAFELAKIFKKSGHGRYLFWQKDMLPTLQVNLDRFYDSEDGGDVKNTLILKMSDDPKIIERFIKSELPHSSNQNFARMVYAYICIKSPEKAPHILPGLFLRNTGAILGAFLRDPKSYESRMTLAMSAQNILGIYTYTPLEESNVKVKNERAVVFATGDTVDYLFIADFAIKSDPMVVRTDDELNLHYGFCTPGTDFSPVIMRSWDMGERLCGLLHNKNVFLDFYSQKFDELSIQYLTSNAERFLRLGEGVYYERAQLILNGPRMQGTLKRPKNINTIKYIEEKFASLALEHLQ